jgi:outer membrane lipoprotein-sorting protein
MRALLCLALLAQDPDEPARAALRKLSERLKDARTLSAKVVQSRRTPLLDRPLASSGTLHFRREPARLVFRLSDPAPAEVHLDASSYQVYRPDQRRLERLDFEGDALAPKLFLAFAPKADEIGASFEVRTGGTKDGAVEVRLLPRDEKVRKHLASLVLTVAEADGTLRRIATRDGEGDETEFLLTDLALNPEAAPGTFELKVPEGTRVFRTAVKPPK